MKGKAERVRHHGFQGDRRSSWLAWILVLLAAFFLLPSLPAGALSMSQGFQPETRLPAVLSMGAPQASELYAKNSQTPIEIPGLARLMTLYLAIERLTSDETLPISGQAALIDSQERPSGRLEMRAGDRLPLRYLLLKLMFDDSDAAAMAIAERISGSGPAFLAEMQQTAGLLGMSQTIFYSFDVARAQRESAVPPEILAAMDDPDQENLPEARDPVETVRSSLRDTMRLFTALINNSRARAILSVSEELVQITSGGAAQIAAIRSPASHLMTLSEGRIQAAFQASSSRYSLLCCTGTSPGSIPVTTVAVSLGQAGAIQAVLQLYQAFDGFYSRTSLTSAGGRYPGQPQEATNGQTFDLIYLDSVDYIHPKADHYLEDTLEYRGTAPYPIPVQKGAMTGQVIFTLKDGLQIPVRVGSDRDILADSNLVGRGLQLLIRNPNLAYTILGTAILLGLGLVWIIFRELARLRFWLRRSRRG